MHRSPVIKPHEHDDRRELGHRIDLANRPRLDVGLQRLDQVAAAVAANRGDRARFISDPTGYLREQSMPVASCHFVAAPQRAAARTSEVCSTAVFCVAEVNVAVRVQSCIAFLLDCAVNTQIRSFVKVIGPIEDAALVENLGSRFDSAIL